MAIKISKGRRNSLKGAAAATPSEEFAPIEQLIFSINETRR